MIINKGLSEFNEIREAILLDEQEHRVQEEIGDLLHCLISISQFAGFDVNLTLEKTI